uniref:CSD domain-containing protein n=1 Tax=Anopheles minimus TaxID=112268 RepID=A0A182WBS3_9DIPT
MANPSGPFHLDEAPNSEHPSSATMTEAQQQDREELVGPRRGRCKWFNVVKGWGFLTPDDGGQEVFVHQSVIQMGGFRSLGENEEVEFESKLTSKGYEATNVYGPSHAECKGSDFRPYSKKRRFRKVRCYNCGEFSNHIASKCALGPLPKRCHNCRSEDHLIADCPTKPPPK